MLFSELSIAEIVDMLESYNRRYRKKREEYSARLKDQIRILDGFAYTLVENLSAKILGGEYKNMEQIFHELFEKERKDQDKTTEKHLSADMQIYKAQRLNHAYRFNKQRATEKG